MGDISNLNVSWRTLLLFGCCFPIVLIAFHLLRQELESQACRFWASFALLFALGITPQIIGFSGFYQVWPGLTFAPFNTDLWLGPLMLLHLRRLCLTETTFSNGVRDLVLLIPGIIQSTYYTICFLFLGDHQAKWAFNDLVHEPYMVPIETLLLLVVTLSCLWHSYRLMQGYQAFLNQTQSQADTFVPVWFKGLLYGLLILTCTWILLEVLSLLLTDFSYTNQYPFYLLMSLIVLWCSILALTDIRSPFPKIYLVAPISDEPKSPEEAITRVIPRDSWQEKYETLHEAMTTQQWYLYPNYLKMPASELSQRFQDKAHLRRNVVTFRTSVTP